MKNAGLNTGLFLFYLLTLLLYWTQLIPGLKGNSILSIFSSMVLIVVTFVYYVQVIGKKKFDKFDKNLIIVFSILIVGHSVFSKTSFLQAANIYFAFCLYLVLPYIEINSKKIYSAILWTLVIITIIGFPSLIVALLNPSNEYLSFSSVFSSSNSIGDWGCSALLCLLLLERDEFPKSNKKYYAGLAFLFIVIFASHMRSAFLVLLAWWLANYLQKKHWKKGVIYVGLIAALVAVGGYMVVSEVISPDGKENDVEVFGKESSSRGRSEQIFVAFDTFDITPWGVGRGVVNESVKEDVRYAVHNAFVASLLEYGWIIFIFYFVYWFRLFKCGPNITTSFILAYHILLFFEPENFFSNQFLPFIAFSVTLLAEGEYRKNLKIVQRSLGPEFKND